jgi:hypothetical protein
MPSFNKVVDSITNDDEEDFKTLRTRDSAEIWDKDFSAFAKWMRQTYGKEYTLPVMRKINYDQFKEYVRNLTLSLVGYIVMIYLFPHHKIIWGIPFLVLVYKYVILKEEFVHMRAHWPTRMTGSSSVDKTIDVSMMVIAGVSRETFKRRHIAAHYADIGNIARIFSDVWLPFVTFPAVYYLYPHFILKIALDREYCLKERLSRKQLFVETVGLYLYMLAIGVELYFGGHYLLCFHLLPLLVYHGGEITGAMLSHSGIDKRNSFDSNGLFGEDCEGLFGIMVWLLNVLANKFPINHGIHHAYTQLPLEIINRDYAMINAHIVSNYQNIRYNQVLAHKVQKSIISKLPPPRWYNYAIQYVVDVLVLVVGILTLIGAPIPPPVAFEWLIVDYRIMFSREERYANLVGFWNTIQLVPRLKEMTSENAYLQLAFRNYSYFAKYLAERGIKPTEFKPEDICPPEVYQLNVVQRGKIKAQ